MNITEFLEARITEDEQLARAASHQKIAGPFHGNWREDSPHLSGMEREDAAHIAHHNPARVLAECAAKRAIIAMYEQGDEAKGWDPEAYIASTVFDAMRALAAVYKDHKDYQQEWAVGG